MDRGAKQSKFPQDWSQHFDVERHTEHGDSPSSKIMVLSENLKFDQKIVDILKSQYGQCQWEVVDLKNLIQCEWSDVGKNSPNNILMKDIREVFRPTNLVLNFSHSNKVKFENWEKGFSSKLKETGLFDPLFGVCDDWECVKFLTLGNIYREPMSGAPYLDSQVTISARWKLEIDSLIEKRKITKEPLKILVLSGTHGSNKDPVTGQFLKIPICGFSNERCLTSDNPKDPKYVKWEDFYNQDLKRANEMMNKDKNLTVVVEHMKHFSNKKKNELRNYVSGQKPDMLIMAWCYSANCDVSMVLRTNGEFSRLVLEAEMRDIGISTGRANLHQKQIEVLKKAQISGVKTMVLTGNTGSGKTDLAAEVTKIWMAEHIENYPEVSHC